MMIGPLFIELLLAVMIQPSDHQSVLLSRASEPSKQTTFVYRLIGDEMDRKSPVVHPGEGGCAGKCHAE